MLAGALRHDDLRLMIEGEGCNRYVQYNLRPRLGERFVTGGCEGHLPEIRIVTALDEHSRPRADLLLSSTPKKRLAPSARQKQYSPPRDPDVTNSGSRQQR